MCDMMTDEQYEYKLNKLRRKRNLHSMLVEHYEREMDRLMGDREKATFTVGKYIRFDTNYYLKVSEVKFIERGFLLKGSGYVVRKGGSVSVIDCVRGYWGHTGLIEEINEEIFKHTLENNLLMITDGANGLSEKTT